MYKCINCQWKGEELSKTPLLDKCPVCGDEVKPTDGKSPVGKASSVKIDVPNKRGIVEKAKDFVGDLADDGKRNYSNRKKKR